MSEDPYLSISAVEYYSQIIDDIRDDMITDLKNITPKELSSAAKYVLDRFNSKFAEIILIDSYKNSIEIESSYNKQIKKLSLSEKYTLKVKNKLVNDINITFDYLAYGVLRLSYVILGERLYLKVSNEYDSNDLLADYEATDRSKSSNLYLDRDQNLFIDFINEDGLIQTFWICIKIKDE